MNEIINKFLSAGDKFMPGIHLRNPGFTHSVCGPFTKNKKRIQKFKETGGSEKTKRELKLSFNMTCFIENLRICLEEQLLINYYVIKHLILPKKTKYDGYQRVHASIERLLTHTLEQELILRTRVL